MDCGRRRCFFRTLDGGYTWEAIGGFFDENFSSIYFNDQNIGWAVTGEGEIWKTENGGLHWSLNYNDPLFDFQDINFIDSLTGWVCGDGGLILKTEDAGLNWTILNTNSFEKLYSIEFINDYVGWACGTNGELLNTQNGGTSWTNQLSYTAKNLYDISFTELNFGWICGMSGTILHTTNGGAVNIDSQEEGKHQYMVSVFPNPTRGNINIDISKCKSKVLKVEIINSLGICLTSILSSNEASSSGFFTIDNASYKTGMYFIVVYFEDKIETKTLIVL